MKNSHSLLCLVLKVSNWSPPKYDCHVWRWSDLIWHYVGLAVSWRRLGSNWGAAWFVWDGGTYGWMVAWYIMVLYGMVGCVGWWCAVWPDWVRLSTQWGSNYARLYFTFYPASNGSTLYVPEEIPCLYKGGLSPKKLILNCTRGWGRNKGQGSSRTYISVRAWRGSHLYEI